MIIASTYMYTITLNSTLKNAKYSSCFFYLIQYDLIAGLDETEYDFIGFDNLNTNIDAFTTELKVFTSIKDNLSNIK